MQRRYFCKRDNHGEEFHHGEKLLLLQINLGGEVHQGESYLFNRDNHGEEVYHAEKIPLQERRPSWRRVNSPTEAIMVRQPIMQRIYLCKRDNHGEEFHHG
jgi:hypothetical protein